MSELKKCAPALALCGCGYAGVLLIAQLAIVIAVLGVQAVESAHLVTAAFGALFVALAARSGYLRLRRSVAAEPSCPGAKR
jgi:hypothetical protein